ncbi:MAG: hypothetical protein WCP29_15970 [Acidobacteriota bacterium]
MAFWQSQHRRSWLRGLLTVGSGVALALSLVAVLTGRSGIRFASWILPVREIWRPLAVGAALCAWRAVLARRDRAASGPPHGQAGVADVLAGVVFACGITAAVLLSAHYQVRDCGGADSYGYVSTAHAAVSGTLIAPQPIVALLPFADPLAAATPFGWTPRPSGDAIVPFYPLGFPLVMAAAIVVGGPTAPFYVPLLAGVGILIATYRLTRQLAGSLVAGATTLVVAFNPTLVNMAIQPMSDVPAAFWYLLSLAGVLVARERPLLSGLAFGMSVWTRPLMLLTAPAMWLVMSRTRRTFARWLLGAAAIGVVMAAFQWWLYGSPFKTGYGGAAGLFTTANLLANAWAYAKWIVIINSPVFLVAVVVGIWKAPRRLAIAATVGFVLGVLPYVFKLAYFDDWDLVRYVLPVLIPCVIMASIGVASVLARRLPHLAYVVALVAVSVGSAVVSYQFLASQATFQLGFQESRYPAVGAWVAAHTPPRAVVLAEGHAGSLRFYAHRTTLRLDQVPPRALAPTVRRLAGEGIECYAVVDGAEEAEQFRQQLLADPDVVADPVGRVREAAILRLREKS